MTDFSPSDFSLMDFSIVTACMNSADTIGDTMRSVLAQTGVSVQHVVKDGRSKDATVEIATLANPQACIVVSADRGVYDAMNQGFAEATGEFIGFLNSDDYYAAPDVLAAVRDAFRTTGSDIVHADISMINGDGQIVRSWTSGALRPGKLDGKQLPHPAVFVRRAALARLSQPFDPSYRISADYKQQLILIEQMKLQATYLPRVATIMRTGGESTRNLQVIVRGWKECARAYREVHNRSGWLMIARKVASKLTQVRLRKSATVGDRQ